MAKASDGGTEAAVPTDVAMEEHIAWHVAMGLNSFAPPIIFSINSCIMGGMPFSPEGGGFISLDSTRFPSSDLLAELPDLFLQVSDYLLQCLDLSARRAAMARYATAHHPDTGQSHPTHEEERNQEEDPAQPAPGGSLVPTPHRHGYFSFPPRAVSPTRGIL